MPRKQNKPTYLKRSEKGRDYAYCYLFGRQKRLGSYGTPESFQRFERYLAAYEQNDEELATYGTEPVREVTVGELALQYAEHNEHRYQIGSLCKDRCEKATHAMRQLTKPQLGFASIAASQFGPKALKTIQANLRESINTRTGHPFARTYVNQTINEIRRAFKWAVSEELVNSTVLEALRAVPSLRAGDGREPEPRMPVDPKLAELTASHLEHDGHVGIACAIRFMRWTGCRPDEACRITLACLEGLDTNEPAVRLQEHKTRKHTCSDRVIPLSERALAVIRQALARGETLEPSRRLFLSRAGEPLRRNGIYQAVTRTCKKYNLQRWTPYQLRHLSATEILEATGSEVVAAAQLGHTPNSTIIRRYSQDRIKLAREGARAIGYREGRSA